MADAVASSALKLQKWWRGLQIRNLIKEEEQMRNALLKAIADALERRQPLIDLLLATQRQWLEAECNEEETVDIEEIATLCIQRVWRGCIARRIVARHREARAKKWHQQQEHGSAVVIQSCWRRHFTLQLRPELSRDLATPGKQISAARVDLWFPSLSLVLSVSAVSLPAVTLLTSQRSSHPLLSDFVLAFSRQCPSVLALLQCENAALSPPKVTKPKFTLTSLEEGRQAIEFKEAVQRVEHAVEEGVAWASLEQRCESEGSALRQNLLALREQRHAQEIQEIFADEASLRANIEGSQRANRREVNQAWQKLWADYVHRRVALQRLGTVIAVRKVQRWCRDRCLVQGRKLRAAAALRKELGQKKRQCQMRSAEESRLMFEHDKRSTLQELDNRAAKIQRAYLYSCLKARTKNHAAVHIQAIVRGYFFRKHWPRVRDLLEEQKTIYRAQQLQRKWVDREEKTEREELVRDFSNFMARIPGFRKAVETSNILRHRQNAATDIQRVWRGSRGRRQFALVQRAFEHLCATRIQAVFRGYRTRLQFTSLRQQTEEWKRQRLEARWRIQTESERLRCVVKIQCATRAWLRDLNAPVPGESWQRRLRRDQRCARRDIEQTEAQERSQITGAKEIQRSKIKREIVSDAKESTGSTKFAALRHFGKTAVPAQVAAAARAALADALFTLALHESGSRRGIEHQAASQWQFIEDLASVSIRDTWRRDKQSRVQRNAQIRAVLTIQKLFRGHLSRRKMPTSLQELHEERDIMLRSEKLDRRTLEREEAAMRTELLRLVSEVARVRGPAPASLLREIADCAAACRLPRIPVTHGRPVLPAVLPLGVDDEAVAQAIRQRAAKTKAFVDTNPPLAEVRTAVSRPEPLPTSPLRRVLPTLPKKPLPVVAEFDTAPKRIPPAGAPPRRAAPRRIEPMTLR